MINNIIEWIATVIQNFLIVWFISNYCGYKFEGKKRYICFGIILAADCLFVGILNRFMPYDGVLSLISVFMYIAYCRVCLKNDLYVHNIERYFCGCVKYNRHNAFKFVQRLFGMENLNSRRVAAFGVCALPFYFTFK